MDPRFQLLWDEINIYFSIVSAFQNHTWLVLFVLLFIIQVEL